MPYIPAKKTTVPRRAAAGLSLVETLLTVFIFAFLLTGMTAGLLAMSQGASRQVTDSRMGYDARRGVDEMLTHMRYAEAVISSRPIGATTYTTSNSTIVMQAQGYNSATAGMILSGIKDYIIFEHDATTKQIRETVLPGIGSERVARNRYVLANDVEAFTATYRVRDVLPVLPLTLTQNAVGAPVVSVNGEIVSAVWQSSQPKGVSIAATGGNIQAVYPVSASDVTALRGVRQVDIAVRFAATDARRIERRLAMSGSACLRNYLLPSPTP